LTEGSRLCARLVFVLLIGATLCWAARQKVLGGIVSGQWVSAQLQQQAMDL
jgi:hypothetical protein